jgi:hypothetical protein
MTSAIDVHGLSPAAVQAVESLVELLRQSEPATNGKVHSAFELFGKAPNLRSAADIDGQIQEERAAWGDR